STAPVWNEPSAALPLAGRDLREDLACDVCVVGAGIAGLSIAYQLTDEGKKVVVLEAQSEIGTGETGHTTAHLTSVIDDRFARVQSIRGKDAVEAAHASHAAAVDRIELNVRTEKIDCGFTRLDGFLFPAGKDGADILADEADVCRGAGIP